MAGASPTRQRPKRRIKSNRHGAEDVRATAPVSARYPFYWASDFIQEIARQNARDGDLFEFFSGDTEPQRL